MVLLLHGTGRRAGAVTFFGGNAGRSCGRAGSACRAPRLPSEPSHQPGGLGGGADIRSGGQLARFAAKWTAAPPLPATTVRRGFHWLWVAILRLFVSPRPRSTNLLFGTPSLIGSARVWSFQFRLNLAFSPICSRSLAPTTDPPVSSSTCPDSTSTSSLPRSL